MMFMICALLSMLGCMSIAMQDPQQLIDQLTLDQKIGQLFMVAAVMDAQENEHFMKTHPYTMDQETVEEYIAKHHVGGIIFLGTGTKDALAHLVQKYQQLSPTIPLMIGLDAEWGLSMRLKDGQRYPRNMTLGAIEDNALIRLLGKQIGHELRELGVHINFAPVVDVNTNPKNPVIHMRSFGADKENVFKKACAYMRGLHDAGILSCAKHFPGHGDTYVDSHHGLPVLNHSMFRLHMIELWPFKKMIKHKVPAIMTAHISVPALDPDGNAASLSKNVVTDLLRRELGFEGLIVTDGLGMQGVLDDNPEPGKVELKALLAGNDILLCPVHVPEAVERIKQAIKEKTLSIDELDLHVLRILSAKQKICALQQNRCADDSLDVMQLKKQLCQSAITLLDEEMRFKPLQPKESICVLHIGQDQAFKESLAADVSVQNITQDDLSSLDGQKVLCIIMGINPRAVVQFDDVSAHKEQDLMSIKNLLEKIKEYNGEVLFVNFCTPYLGNKLKEYGVVIQAYEYDDMAAEVVKEILLGQREAQGELPI